MAARAIGHRRKLETPMAGLDLIFGVAKDRQLWDLIGAGALQKLLAHERQPLKDSTSHHADGSIVGQDRACAAHLRRHTKLEYPLLHDGMSCALFP